jgi:cell division protein FtsB
VRWDKLGRIAMLCVAVALAYLYMSAGVRLFSTWRESKRDSAQVRVLERRHSLLEQQHTALSSPVTLQEEARRLDMVRPGEQAYVVSGLPPN